ncbi:MAG: hypothetical protein IIA60_07625 [Candidatus Marinimicrobia bacterium]|nr:hypothetical protein [Candidatus Neomarinimicrobiota bacterium]
MGLFKGFPVTGTSSENLATSASSGGGATAIVTLAAGTTGKTSYLTEAVWSYSTTPETGGLNVYSGTSSGALMFSVDITASGPDGMLFSPLSAALGDAVTVELLQAGSSITGKLNAYGYNA